MRIPRCLSLAGLVMAASGATRPAPAVAEDPPSRLRFIRTEHLGALTPRMPTMPAALGFAATDLGVSFERDGKVILLFGDCWGAGAEKDADAAATAPRVLPADGTLPELSWITRADGRFQPLTVPGVDLGGFNVPVEGLAVGKTTYVFFTTGWSHETKRHTASVLAHCEGLEFAHLTLDHREKSDKFLNVSAVVEGETAWIFGSGVYRKSAVYLAKVPVKDLADRKAWTYAPDWNPDEKNAEALFPCACVGELSVRRHPTMPLWLMTYNADSPRGITLRTAPSPGGPWSEPTVIFDPTRAADLGYEHFLHRKESDAGADDGLSDRGRNEEWGGEYGPYLVPSWFSLPKAGLVAITYTLSSWNPYQVHVMRTWLGMGDVAEAPAARFAGPARVQLVNGDFATGDTRGWSAQGDPFVVFELGGTKALTTYGAKQDATVGKLWQEFTVGAATSELSFRVHGGSCAVNLLDGDRVIRASRGRKTNDVETAVRWRLDGLRGKTLRLVIDDDQTNPWGFVGARGFELK